MLFPLVSGSILNYRWWNKSIIYEIIYIEAWLKQISNLVQNYRRLIVCSFRTVMSLPIEGIKLVCGWVVYLHVFMFLSVMMKVSVFQYFIHRKLIDLNKCLIYKINLHIFGIKQTSAQIVCFEHIRMFSQFLEIFENKHFKTIPHYFEKCWLFILLWNTFNVCTVSILYRYLSVIILHNIVTCGQYIH